MQQRLKIVMVEQWVVEEERQVASTQLQQLQQQGEKEEEELVHVVRFPSSPRPQLQQCAPPLLG